MCTPSQRINQIIEELKLQWNPAIPLSQEQYQYMKLQAVINYLDEEYDKDRTNI